MRDAADRSADHRADKQAWAEDTAGVSGRIADWCGNELHDREYHNDLDWKIAGKHAVNVVVADAEHLRHEQSENSHQEAAGDRLQPDRRRRKSLEPNPQFQK